MSLRVTDDKVVASEAGVSGIAGAIVFGGFLAPLGWRLASDWTKAAGGVIQDSRLLLSGLCGACVVGVVYCVHRGLRPPVPFTATADGITITYGEFPPQAQTLAWDRLRALRPGEMIVAGRSTALPKMKSIELVFDRQVDLGNTGYPMSRPVAPNVYAIAEDFVRDPAKFVAAIVHLSGRHDLTLDVVQEDWASNKR